MSNVKRLVHDEFARARQQWDRPAVETTAVQDWYTSHRNEIGTAIYHQAEQDSNQRTQSPSIELWMDVSSRDYTQEFQFCMGFAARAASMIEPLATNAVQGVLRLFVNPLKDVVTRKLNQDLRQWLSNVDLSTEELRVASQEQSKLLALIRKHTPSP
ncbi:hypothetical protein SISSUDRAFT_1055399 [Sistotremastrum suecicum HHB10207 ss-3]|uniref:Uncharacterized protein n=1 Tax=Sistotremastrum suecicum HHB10207 ss-3 TaxID=1314776 RepID=A0A165XTR4_9AGAM|nr:hypothetical protein SISSUDRAFT_1055399 [Sistotremastrum suecicum HHB10207 ss-3]